MKRMNNACIKTILVILLSIMGNALFAQSSTQISSKQLNLYAVNSMEGLRVRSFDFHQLPTFVDRHWNKTADLWDKLE